MAKFVIGFVTISLSVIFDACYDDRNHVFVSSISLFLIGPCSRVFSLKHISVSLKHEVHSVWL